MKRLVLGLMIGFLVALPAGASALGLLGTNDIQDFAITKRKLHSNSVNSLKIIDGSIKLVDLSAKAKAALKGAKGATGAKGDQGIQGIAGADGLNGADADYGIVQGMIDTAIAAIQGAIDNLETLVAGLTSRVDDHDVDIANLNTALTSSNIAIENLNARLTSAEAEIEILKGP